MSQNIEKLPYDGLTIGGTYAAVTLVFAPVLYWLAVQTSQNDQLQQVLIILGALVGYLAWDNRKTLNPVFRHDNLSLGLLISSLVLVGAQTLLPDLQLLIGALILAAGGLLRFTFGQRGKRLLRALLIAFGGFVIVAFTLPYLDWPLRMLSGKLSAAVLHLIGDHPSLYMAEIPEPALVLTASGRPFIVAAECNGYGLLISSVLMTLFLAYYQGLKLLDRAILLIFAFGIAIAGNLCRIVVIVLLAPHVANYDLMHEIVGISFYYSVLGLLGWLTWTCPQRTSQ